MRLLRENRELRWLVVAPSVSASAAATDSIAASLRTSPSITAVERNGAVRIPRPIASSPAAAAIVQQDGTCTRPSDPLNPDFDLGREGEGVPYGIKAVQGDDPVIKQLASEHSKNVMYCSLDTGLDFANQEFNRNSAHAPGVQQRAVVLQLCGARPKPWHAARPMTEPADADAP